MEELSNETQNYRALIQSKALVRMKNDTIDPNHTVAQSFGQTRERQERLD